MKALIKKISVVIALLFVTVGVVGPLKMALAAESSLNCNPGDKGCDYQPLTTIPSLFTEKVNTNPIKVISNIYGLSIGIAGVLAVAMITWAGFQYATTEAITGKSDAKEHWEGALWGLAILLGSYILLRTINADLVNIDLSLGDPLTGSKLSANANRSVLEDVERQSSSAIAESQAAQQRFQDAQNKLKSLATLQAQKDAWEKERAAIDPNTSATGDGLRLAELNKQIADANETINAAKKEASESETAATASLAKTQLAQTLTEVTRKIDNDNLDEAKRLQKVGDEASQQSIDKLKSNPETPVSVIKEAEVKKIAVSSDISQKILIADQLNAIDGSRQAGMVRASDGEGGMNYDLSADTATQQKIIQARAAIAANFSKAQVDIRAIDPSQTDSVRASTLANQADFDAKVAKMFNCSKGVTVTTTSVSCKQ